MSYEASLRAPADAHVVEPAPAAHEPLPASLFRTIRPAAWLAVLAAGLAGWALLFALI